MLALLLTAAVRAAQEAQEAARDARRVGRRAALGVVIDTEHGGVHYLLRQAFVVERGTPFILQDFADLSVAERMRPVFDAIWDGLGFPPRSAEAEEHAALVALAARCGSEVRWADGWSEASARARAGGRPVLVAARMYPGWAITDDRMSGPFMDPDIVALLDTRYVPMSMRTGDEVPFARPDAYGLGPNAFGEAALVVSPDGEVLGESAVLWDAWLRGALAVAPDLAGTPVPADASGLARAQAHSDRGELDAAEALLAGADTCDALLLRARLHSRLARGARALADLDRAEALADTPARRERCALDRVRVVAGLGRLDEADALLDGVQGRMASLGVPVAAAEDAAEGAADHAAEDAPDDAGDGAPDDARRDEALLLRATVARAFGRREQAEGPYGRVLDECGGTRWAWLAAAALTSTAWELGTEFRVAWIAPEDKREFDPVRYEPLPSSRAVRAREDALDYLLAEQQADGSWRVPAEVGRDPAGPRHDFELAVSALCIQSLLPYRERRQVGDALARAEAWLHTAIDEAGSEAAFMDYAVWSRACMLWCVAELVGSAPEGRAERAAAWDGRARRLVSDLGRREKPGGGWSCYVTQDLRASGTARARAMSFTTAAVVLALIAAQDAGLHVPRAMLERGLDAVERAGSDRRTYTYMVGEAGPGAERPDALAGDAGRGPVCALALHRGGRASRETVEDALDRFAAHRDAHSAELGKTLLHTGPEGQGSHDLMFDYANAALAVASLPPARRARHRRALLTDVLRARTREGAFLDTAVNGRAYGAAMALLALDALR